MAVGGNAHMEVYEVVAFSSEKRNKCVHTGAQDTSARGNLDKKCYKMSKNVHCIHSCLKVGDHLEIKLTAHRSETTSFMLKTKTIHVFVKEHY